MGWTVASATCKDNACKPAINQYGYTADNMYLVFSTYETSIMGLIQSFGLRSHWENQHFFSETFEDVKTTMITPEREYSFDATKSKTDRLVEILKE